MAHQCGTYQTVHPATGWKVVGYGQSPDALPFQTPRLHKAHQKTFFGTRSKDFSRSTMANWRRLLAVAMYFCSWQTMKMASVVSLPGTKANCISSIFTILWMEKSSTHSSSFSDFICNIETMVITTVKGFILALIDILNEAVLLVYWDHTTAENSLC